MVTGTRVFQVDAFTDGPFGGNPAAVCLLDEAADPAWMQAVAAEMNLSETAFAVPGRGGSFGLRWFTPSTEVALCGHATLSTAHILWETGAVPRRDAISFHTDSGRLAASWSDGWPGGCIELDFPAYPSAPAELPEAIRAAVAAAPLRVAVIDERGQPEPTYLLELSDESAVRGVVPRLDHLRRPGASSIIVTALAESASYDIVSRYFAPGVGIDEDPVTGAAHCCLAPYWSRRLGKAELVGYQASRRGGVVGMRVAGDRVVLRGQAVTVLRGELLV